MLVFASLLVCLKIIFSQLVLVQRICRSTPYIMNCKTTIVRLLTGIDTKLYREDVIGLSISQLVTSGNSQSKMCLEQDGLTTYS